jgi:tryptophanyl-tRNA synthetase
MKTLENKKEPTHLSGPMFGLMPFVKLFLGEEKAKYYQQLYITTGIKYAGLKAEIDEAIYKELKPFQERRVKIAADQKYIDEVIEDGARRARKIAQETVHEVKEKMGLL